MYVIYIKPSIKLTIGHLFHWTGILYYQLAQIMQQIWIIFAKIELTWNCFRQRNHYRSSQLTYWENLYVPSVVIYLLVISYRLDESLRKISINKITAAAVARAFVHYWVLVYRPPKVLLSQISTKFTSQFFT